MEDIIVKSPEGIFVETAIDKAKPLIAFYREQGYQLISMQFNNNRLMYFEITFRKEEVK